MFMSAQRLGQMLPESCGCQPPPFFPAKTSGSEDVWIRPSTTRRCLRRSGRIPTSSRGEEVLVAEMDGRIVGCATVEDRGSELELVNIDVLLQLQVRGIGTMLVRSVEVRARAEGKDAVTAGTSRNAEGVAWKSLPWWQHLGYQVTHEEVNAWTRSIGPEVREIRLRKELSTE